MEISMRVFSIFMMCMCTGFAYSQADPDFGFEFVTIGDPGNRATLDEELGELVTNRHVGAVDYEYRIATLEVTVGQYFEFVQVYHPYYTANTGRPWAGSDFTGSGISVVGGTAWIDDGVSPNRPAVMNWRYATRYINWLHNDRVNEEWAFETGVYDTSTYTQNDDGSWNFQEFHNPGARFWIPNLG